MQTVRTSQDQHRLLAGENRPQPRTGPTERRNYQLLLAAGWHVIVIWECQLAPKNRSLTLRELDVTLSRIVLNANGATPSHYLTPDEGQDQTPLAAEAAVHYTITSSSK